MGARRYTQEQVLQKLAIADTGLGKGKTIAQVCSEIGVTVQTYYRWRRRVEGTTAPEDKRFREIEVENARLRQLVVDLSLENSTLRERVRADGNDGATRCSLGVSVGS